MDVPAKTIRKSTRRLPLLALVLALAAGCGSDRDGDGGNGGGLTDPPVGGSGSINFVLSPTSVSLVQGESDATTLTLIRGGGFNGAVQLSIEDAPDGVTGTFSPATIPAGATSSTLTLLAAEDAEPGNHTITVRASADGVEDATALFGVTVEYADDPDFGILLETDLIGVLQGGEATVGVAIERLGGFDGKVTLTIEGMAPGMASMVMGDEIRLWLGRYVHVGDHTLTVRGVAGDLTHTAELVVRVFEPRPVAAARSHSLAIAQDGSLWSWGRNHRGQLGLGNTTDQDSPVQVGADTDWVAVAGGNSHSIALKADGSLWVAGGNDYGQLGIAGDEHATFRRVGDDSDWVAIAAGDDFTLAIKADRSLWAWGRNRFGQLGTGNTAGQDAPVRVAGEDWIQVAGGADHTVAVKADGTLWTWGDDSYGQLGNGDATGHVTQPQQVGTANDWLLASAGIGGGATVAIKTDHTLWAWGRNVSGELGLGEDVEAPSPQQVGHAMDWVYVSTGAGFTLAIDADGYLWATGANARGRLGINEPGEHNRYELVQALGSAWDFVSAGEGHALGVGPDGFLYAWGSNEHGKLGFGTDAVQGNGPVGGFKARWP